MNFEKLAELVGAIIERIPVIKERYCELGNNVMDDGAVKLLDIELYANTIADMLEDAGIHVEINEDAE